MPPIAARHTGFAIPAPGPCDAADMNERNRARERMLRRRRRTVLLVTLLALVLAGWTWRAGPGPKARAGDSALRQSSVRTTHASAARHSPSPKPTPGPSASTAAPQSGLTTAASGRLVVVPGTSPVFGTGPVKRFAVEVEDGLDDDAEGFAAFVVRTLSDARSWTSPRALSLQRVDSGPVAFRVTLASPHTVDRYCAPLDTNSYTSCYDGRGRAMLNVTRWRTGVPWYAGDMTTYREYMVNHEVGHALGHHHAYCSGPGGLAPVMQQQTLGMQGCRHNAWPYP